MPCNLVHACITSRPMGNNSFSSPQNSCYTMTYSVTPNAACFKQELNSLLIQINVCLSLTEILLLRFLIWVSLHFLVSHTFHLDLFYPKRPPHLNLLGSRHHPHFQKKSLNLQHHLNWYSTWPLQTSNRTDHFRQSLLRNYLVIHLKHLMRIVYVSPN